MRRVGFVDYFLDNWHSANYPAWIAAHERGYGVCGAWAQCDAPGGLSTDAWCARHAVERYASLENLIADSDALIVLSPNHPEMHEALCELPLTSGKPTYVDKTFAPDRASAQRLFDRAARYGTPMFSSSALRYSPDARESARAARSGIDALQVRGPGAPSNYSIHQIELIVSLMGTGARRAVSVGSERAPSVAFAYDDGRGSQLSHFAGVPFGAQWQDREGNAGGFTVERDFWQPFIDELLRFFDTRTPAVNAEQTLETIAMYEAACAAVHAPGQWVSLKRG